MQPEGAPPDQNRRRLLLALGFGAANLGALRHLGTNRDQPPTVVAGTSEERISASDDGPSGIGAPPASPRDIPVLDASVEVTDPNHQFDVVINDGRVIDPASEYDGVATIGIDGDRVTYFGYEPRTGRRMIDARERVVAPGFIDILSYSPNDYGEWYKIADGVTCNLGMHGLDRYANDWFPRYADAGVPVHYGGASDNAYLRPQLGLEPFSEPSADEIDSLVADAESDLRDGFIGIHMQPEYTPGATRDEVLAHGRLAARLEVPLCLHARYSDNLEPGVQADAIAEVVAVARETGCHVHVEHINSTGGTGRMADALATLDAARAEGLSVTACVYPYTFWATYLQSARFDEWQTKYGISYDALQVAGTSERLTETTYQQAYDANKLTAAFAIPEDDVVMALQAPWVMVGSDAILEPSHNNHPRSTGCFARVLGHYVRDESVISLMSGLAKMTSLPAALLERRAPALQRKGRLQIGSDADITVFDPMTVSDRSTLVDPAQMSVGVDWVLVDGTLVKDPSGVDRTVRPGRAITSSLA